MNTETTKPIRVLLIEDNSGDARLIQEGLKEIHDIDFSLEHVSQLKDGMDYVAGHEVDIILSDLSLPDSPGMETFKRLQAQTTAAPVIVLTGFDNEAVALDAVRQGAQDYLIKGQVDGRSLSRTILYAIERHRSQSSLRNLSLSDELTGLYNRRGFMTLAEQSLKSAQRTMTGLVLFYIDLDGLKKINDSYGHPDGDRAIVAAAKILRQTFRQADIVARLGGDEFAILAAGDQDGGHGILLSRLNGNLAQYNLQNPQAYKLALSAGVAHFDPHEPVSLAVLLELADKELYKKKGKTIVSVSAPHKSNRVRRFVWIALLILLLLVGFLYLVWLGYTFRPVIIPAHIPAGVRAVVTPIVKTAHARRPRAVAAAPSGAIWSLPSPPPLELHRELIPSNISIARFTYDHPINPPGVTIGFDIVGSGFTAAFQKVLSVYSGSPHVQVHNLHLVTVNQIHGDMVIHSAAPTQYVFPDVLVNDTPVFQAATPFAIIRPRDVLNIVFTRMDADGKGGAFRGYTNLSDDDTRSFAVRSDVTGIDVAALSFRLPYVVEGNVRIDPQVPRGAYDLSALLGNNEIFRKKELIQVVRPTVGESGIIQGLSTADQFYRPGDLVKLILNGRGFEEKDISNISVRLPSGQDVPMQFISKDKLEAAFALRPDEPEGIYNADVRMNGQTIYSGKDIFSVVGTGWIRSSALASNVRPGQTTTLTIDGRDFTLAFAQSVTITSDDPGIHIRNPLLVDANTLRANVQVDASVHPGEYLLKIMSEGHPVTSSQRTIITIQP